MLAIQPPTSSTTKPKQITPNILPAKIHHNGPIPTPKRYWNPTTSTSTNPQNNQEVYLRGRKLLGHKIALPEGYEGVVLQKTLPVQRKDDGEGEEEEEEDVEVKILEQKGKFKEIVVWGHEVVPGEEDYYRKGIEEWMGFAEAIHAYDVPTNNTT